ncbi:hypothetical protein JK628_01640 [Shewanella sp. KX20019]|uniref:hypothetical protein n=1 Tax=Shewanella sp. KX20019 TaxID=2803864 RepID=UPI0019295798|nr:hypothetical protein [Shewanella sp. KX20019]QQX80608.1 hypothetical protein JK628_01640 [Shewanella sp. KX20019]
MTPSWPGVGWNPTTLVKHSLMHYQCGAKRHDLYQAQLDFKKQCLEYIPDIKPKAIHPWALGINVPDIKPKAIHPWALGINVPDIKKPAVAGFN